MDITLYEPDSPPENTLTALWLHQELQRLADSLNTNLNNIDSQITELESRITALEP